MSDVAANGIQVRQERLPNLVPWGPVILGAILLVGVLWFSRSSTTEPERLAPLAGAIEPIDVPIALRSQATTIALDDGRVMLWGGEDVDTDGRFANVPNLFTTGIVYDPATDTVTHVPEAPGPPRSSAAGVWTGTEAIIWGGATSTLPVRLDPGGIAWNPATEAWRELPDAPHGASHPRVAAFEDGVLFMNGLQTDGRNPGDLWFDLRTETWTVVHNPRFVITTAWVDGDLYATGSPQEYGHRMQALRFDERELAWTPVGSPLHTDWMAIAPDASGELTAVAHKPGPGSIVGHVLRHGRWLRVAGSLSARDYIMLDNPSHFPPLAVMADDVLLFGGQFGLLAWDPDARELSGLTDERVHTLGGSAVWTGEQLVQLVSQSAPGWTWTPDPPATGS